ncbi:MAG: prephenate dehydrogenase [Candidatus Goldbacteria bacterium]|nr:prephenate dehydrogenase [Candidatus Goldiibacteriota bacterium]
MTIQKNKTIAIIGMGFMGGSLGAILLRKKLCKNVVGIGRNVKKLKIALKKKAATFVTTDLIKGVQNADIVIIALPVNLIPATFIKIKSYLSKDTIVTDMGSVKGIIVEKIREVDYNKNFIGSHPMVGSEKSGIKNIIPEIFQNGTCIITPDNNSDIKKITLVEKFWKSVGMKVVRMNAKLHDKQISRISHFPHIISFVLTNMAAQIIRKNREIIGRGFKDVTRIAASDEEMWSDIFIANKNEVLKDIDIAIEELDALSQMIYLNKEKELKNYILNARELREKI